jgi:xylan 1,4-beta-xylosidase
MVRSIIPICAHARCPDSGVRRSGRETALQKCTWGEDGWLRLAQGGLVPDVDGESAPDPESRRTADPLPSAEHSPVSKLPDEFQWLQDTISRADIFTLTGSEPCVCMRANRSAAGLSRRWWQGGRSTSSLPCRDHLAVRTAGITSRQPVWFTTTIGTSSISLPSPGMSRLGRSLSILSCPGDWPDMAELEFPLEANLSRFRQTDRWTSPWTVDSAELAFSITGSLAREWQRMSALCSTPV